MDIEMRKNDGDWSRAEVSNKYPQIQLSWSPSFRYDEIFLETIQAGADGYLLKEVDGNKSLHQGILRHARRWCCDGDPSVAMKALKFLRKNHKFSREPKRGKSICHPRNSNFRTNLPKELNYNIIGENLLHFHQERRSILNHIYGQLQVHSNLSSNKKALKNRINWKMKEL